jgi:hypothetical protein
MAMCRNSSGSDAGVEVGRGEADALLVAIEDRVETTHEEVTEN